MILKNRIKGRIAKKQGSQFEDLCERLARAQGFVTLRVQDGMKRIGRGGSQVVAVPNLVDLILMDGARVIFTDCKRRDVAKITKTVFSGKSTQRQLAVMLDIEKRTRHMAGFTVYMAEANQTVFVRASDLDKKPIPTIKLADNMLPNFKILLTE
jgi:hypothetical protein